MRILNDIACNLNRIQISSIQSKFNWIKIQLKKNEIQVDTKTIENFLIVFIICDYGVKMKVVLKNKSLKNTFPFHFEQIPNQNLFW